MTNIFNEYTLFFRKKYFKNQKKTTRIIVVISIILFILSYLIDSRVTEINRWINMGRTLITAINALILFPLISLMIEVQNDKKEDFTSYKERLSFNQRLNLSIIIVSISIFIHILLVPTTSNFYSIISTFLLVLILYMVNFSMKTAYEKDLEKKGLIDIRDMNHILDMEDKKDGKID